MTEVKGRLVGRLICHSGLHIGDISSGPAQSYVDACLISAQAGVKIDGSKKYVDKMEVIDGGCILITNKGHETICGNGFFKQADLIPNQPDKVMVTPEHRAQIKKLADKL